MAKLQAIDFQKKFKTDIQIQRVAKHNLRQGKQTANVNTSLSHLNKYLVGNKSMNVLKDIEKKLDGVKYRKDAAKTAHMVFSVSPEWFHNASDEDRLEWEKRTMDYVKDTFGEQNIVYSVVHYDETTPHIHCCAVPLVNGKLNMKAIFNGKKGLADNFHTKYNTYINHLGIERGERYSRSSAVDIREYTERLKQSQQDLEDRVNLFQQHIESCIDSPTKLNRLFDYVKTKIMPAFQALKDKNKAKDKELIKTQQKLAKYEELLLPLSQLLDIEEIPSKSHINTLIDDFNKFKHTNTLEHKNNIANVLKNVREQATEINNTQELKTNTNSNKPGVR